jgi:cytochrome P450
MDVSRARRQEVGPRLANTRGIREMPGPRDPSIVQFLRWYFEHDFYNRNAERYGTAFRLSFPVYGTIAMFTTSAAAEQILKLPPSVAHSGMEIMREGMGPHAVVLLDGEEHLRMRKLLLPPLHGERLKRWEAFIEERTLRDIGRWELGTPFSIRPIAERITLDVISRIVFGMRDASRGEELRRLLPSIYNFNVLAGAGFISPLGRIDLGPWTPWGAYRRRRDQIDRLIYSEIEQRRREFAALADDEATVEERSDLLSMLIMARDEDGNGMTNAELRDQLIAMLLAGHETSATAIAWALERLLHTQHALERLLASLERDEDDPTYLDAVIKETLRLRPVAHEVPRVLAQDAVIDGWDLPRGIGLAVAITVLHKDPTLYPDPEAFRPERFLDGNDPGAYAWLPFGGGVRRCPGASLAQMEMRVVLRTILRTVRLAPDRPEPERPTTYHVTIVPDRGGRVVVKERLRARPHAGARGAAA